MGGTWFVTPAICAVFPAVPADGKIFRRDFAGCIVRVARTEITARNSPDLHADLTHENRERLDTSIKIRMKASSGLHRCIEIVKRGMRSFFT